MSGVKRLIVACLLLCGTVWSQEWKSVKFEFNVSGVKHSRTILIPIYPGEKQPPVRGVIRRIPGLIQEFAYRNQVAMISKPDDGRGFSDKLLEAAAEASGRPEIEYAGAIVQGVSRMGRDAAAWAQANEGRAIAVVLDHSWCGPAGIGQPVNVPNVPMYFNATRDDLYQGYDRRMLHYNWCTETKNQPCTAVIDYEPKGKHSSRGTTTLTAIWLEEVMMHRVPMNIPVGKRYKLIDVNPKLCGGSVNARMGKIDKRTFHTDVSIQLPGGSSSWWMPGPATAALYLDWVQRNGGLVKKDDSLKIRAVPQFIKPTGDLAKVATAFKQPDLASALTILKASKTIDPALSMVLQNVINREVSDFLKQLEVMETAGDANGVMKALQARKKLYAKVPEFDEKSAYYAKLYSTAKGQVSVKPGKM